MLQVFMVTVLLAASPDPILQRSLDGLRKLALQYEDSALRFTCDKTIQNHSHSGRKEYSFRYFYRRRDDGRLDDYRQATAKRGPQTLGEAQLPSAIQRAYSWIFLFDTYHAPHYDYSLAGMKTVDGRHALGLRAYPRGPRLPGVNDWVATAWICQETGDLLRVEAISSEDYAYREAYEHNLRLPNAPLRSYSFTEVTTTFDMTHGNLRLPGEVQLIGLTYFGRDKRPRRDFLVRQIYRNYRFYEVNTSTGVDLPAPAEGN